MNNNGSYEDLYGSARWIVTLCRETVSRTLRYNLSDDVYANVGRLSALEAVASISGDPLSTRDLAVDCVESR